MAKWIKKVSSAPLRVVGHILDSLSGNSTENAPSIRAVNSALNAINVPLGDLSDYGENHTLVDAVGVLTTAEQSRYEDLTGAVVNTYGNTYNATYSLVRYGRVLEFRAHVENIPAATQIDDILVLPSAYIRSAAGRIGTILMATETDVHRRQCFINTNGKVNILYQSDSVQSTSFYISATWIY